MSSEPALEQERATRESLFLKATLIVDGREHEGRVSNLSETGAFVVADARLVVGRTIAIQFRGIERMDAVIRRATGKGYGIQFAKSIDPRSCRLPVDTRQDKKPADYMLHLRENGRRAIWDHANQPFRRPGVKEAR